MKVPNKSLVKEETMSYSVMSDPPSRFFLEAVQCKHLLGIKTTHPDPRFREIIVQPHWISKTEYGRDEQGSYRKVDLQSALWCTVSSPNSVVGMPHLWQTNRDILLSEIIEWKIMSETDMTSRVIPQKKYRVFEGHPARNALLEWDMALRRAWSEAAAKPDFDPAPFIEKDKRLEEIADEIRGWFGT